MKGLLESIAKRLRKKEEGEELLPVELMSSEEREQLLIWYHSEEAEQEYSLKTVTEKTEYMKSFLRIIRKGNFLSLFKRGSTYLDEFSRLFVLLAETKNLSFSGYAGTISAQNPILKFYTDYFFRNVEENCLIDDLIGCLNLNQTKENDEDEQIKFLKRAIISIFYKSGEKDQNLPFAFRVENEGFFCNTVNFVNGSSDFTRNTDLPIDKHYNPKEILIGSSGGDRRFYRFNEKPLALLVCENRESRDEIFNDIILHSLEGPDFKTKLIIFDSCSTFEKFENLPILFWPVIRGSRRTDYMMEQLYRLVNARSEGRNMEKAEEIIVVFDDMVKLNSTKFLPKIAEKAFSARVHFVYPLIEDRVPVSTMIQYSDFFDVSNTEPFFSTEEAERLIEKYSYIMPDYDPAYYICEESLNWTEIKHNKTCDDSDPLFKSALKYALQFETVSVNVFQKKFGIGYHRARDLVDSLEELGILGQMDETGNRRVLCALDDDQIDEIDRIRKGML